MLVNNLRVDAIVWLQSKYVRNLLNGDISYFHSNKLGAMTDTLTRQCPSAAGTVADVSESLFATTMVIAYRLAAFLISPVLTAGALIVFVAVSVGRHHFVTKAKRIGAVQVSRDSELQVSTIESLSGTQVVKAFLLEPLRWTVFHQRSQAHQDLLV